MCPAAIHPPSTTTNHGTLVTCYVLESLVSVSLPELCLLAGKEAKQPATTATQVPAPVEDSSALIIGSIVEKPSVRSVSHAVPYSEQPVDGTGTQKQAAAFPPVQHRKQSKFSLARKKQTSDASASTATAPVLSDTALSSNSLLPTATGNSSEALQKDASANAGGAPDEAVSVREIQEQNNEFIARLTPLEVCDSSTLLALSSLKERELMTQ